MQQPFRSFLDPRHIEFLRNKLDAREISPEECKELLKRAMLRGYKKKQAESASTLEQVPMPGWQNRMWRMQKFFSPTSKAANLEVTDELLETGRTKHF